MLYNYVNWSYQSNNNRSLKKNDLVTFAGVIAARLHFVRATREWTNNETKVANYLTKTRMPHHEVDELLMKSVIVHLIILHASIPNDGSPLAAYLHKLQVCENDFILACPSDVEGVVMNAVASFRYISVENYTEIYSILLSLSVFHKISK
ncbi:12137_t:CDS:2 [Gigaspora rosea]|nr:12137_t:CDS:2 [Gigaspora rosea]